MTDMDLDKVIAKLIPMECERLTGWQGPGGAAYNAISEGLCEMGLLNWDWSLTETGLALRARLLAKETDQ